LLRRLPAGPREGRSPTPSSPTFVIGDPSSLYFLGHPWPGGMAEQCNRHRRKGGQCLSPSRRLRIRLREFVRPPTPNIRHRGSIFLVFSAASLAWWHGRAVQPAPTFYPPSILQVALFLENFYMLRLLTDPTPAGWLQGGTLLAFSGPCLSPSELVRSSKSWRPSPPMRPDGASMVLATFAETKVARRPGRNPACHIWTPPVLQAGLPSDKERDCCHISGFLRERSSFRALMVVARQLLGIPTA
jgi:hypothetical protein